MSLRPVRDESVVSNKQIQVLDRSCTPCAGVRRSGVRRSGVLFPTPHTISFNARCLLGLPLFFPFPFKRKLGHIWLQRLPQALLCSHLPLEILTPLTAVHSTEVQGAGEGASLQA